MRLIECSDGVAVPCLTIGLMLQLSLLVVRQIKRGKGNKTAVLGSEIYICPSDHLIYLSVRY